MDGADAPSRYPGCTHAHADAATWDAWTDGLLRGAVQLSSKRRNITHREIGFASDCIGVDCIFLDAGTRESFPTLLSHARYNGSSAEIGVWHGDYSSRLLHSWGWRERRGGANVDHVAPNGIHWLVDPYENFRTGCNERGGTGQWHCLHSQQTFDAEYEAVQKRFAQSRARLVRNFSVNVAATLAPRSLDFAYLDGRHDYSGLLEDLRAWAPLICPGGVLAGHDYTDHNVARAVGHFGAEDLPRILAGLARRAGARTRVYITPDNPASWLLFVPPVQAPRLT